MKHESHIWTELAFLPCPKKHKNYPLLLVLYFKKSVVKCHPLYSPLQLEEDMNDPKIL
jgi:hypothetical protein